MNSVVNNHNGLQSTQLHTNLQTSVQQVSMDEDDEDIIDTECSEGEEDDEQPQNANTASQLSLIDRLAKGEKRPKRDQLTHNGSSMHFQTAGHPTNAIQSSPNGSNVHHSSQPSLMNSAHPLVNNSVASLPNLPSSSVASSTTNSPSLAAHQHFAAAALTAAQQHLNTAFGLQGTTTNNLLNHNNSFVHSLANNSLNGQALTNGQFDLVNAATSPPNLHVQQQQQTLQHLQHNLQHLHSFPLAHPHPAFLAALQRH